MVEGRRTLLEMECELDDGEGPAGSDTQGRPSGVDTSSLEFSCFLICSSWNSMLYRAAQGAQQAGQLSCLAETEPEVIKWSKTQDFKMAA